MTNEQLGERLEQQAQKTDERFEQLGKSLEQLAQKMDARFDKLEKTCEETLGNSVAMARGLLEMQEFLRGQGFEPKFMVDPFNSPASATTQPKHPITK